MPPAPRALKAISGTGLGDRLRGLFGRSRPRAHVVAAPAVRLGGRLPVEWRIEHAGPELREVRVTLVGSEIARQRISGRTGISVVSATHPFLTLEIDRHVPDSGAHRAEGRGEVTLTAPAVPTLAGKVNEIAWAIVVEVAFAARPPWRDQFPIIVLPVQA
jgi:hypothetical protein